MIHVEKMETGEGRTFREKPQADPGGAAMTEAEHMRWVISEKLMS